MSSMSRRRPAIYYAAPAFTLSVLILWVLLNRHHEEPFTYPPPKQVDVPEIEKEVVQEGWDFVRDARNLLMSDARCDEAFPGLFKEVDRAVEMRQDDHITKRELDSIKKVKGYMRAMIYDQQLYVLDKAEKHINMREQATLHALHRAILTSPEPLPNIEFSFISDDTSSPGAIWAYSRNTSDSRLWLMPDFGYWSWPEPKIGAYLEVQMKATAMDSKTPWAEKKNKLIWRGASMELLVREQLVNVSRGHDWADVKIFSWEEEALKPESKEILTMDQHCKYKYVAHTEGISYSARLQNLQNCNSVIVAHKLNWIQHHHQFMVSSGPDQNFVEVAADFSNLPETMERLMANDAESERIAANNIKTFREHYLTPAAETCYWRKLIKGYAKVGFDPDFFDSHGKWRGLPVESFLLMRELDWKPH